MLSKYAEMSLRSKLASFASSAPVDDSDDEHHSNVKSTRPKTFDIDAAEDSSRWDGTDANAAFKSKNTGRNGDGMNKAAAGAGDKNSGPGATRSALRSRSQFIADIENDPKYAGKVVKHASKAVWHDDDDEDADNALSEDDEEDQVDADDDLDEETSDDELNAESDDAENENTEQNDEDDDADDSDSESAGDSSSQQDDEPGNANAVDAAAKRAALLRRRAAETGDVDTELQALAASDAAAMARYHSNANEDAAKGAAVQAQCNLFESWLESRVHLQKLLTGSHRLPRGDAFAAARDSDPQVTEACGDARHAIATLLTDLLQLRAALLSRVPEVASAAVAAAGVETPDNGSDDDDEDVDDKRQQAAEQVLRPAAVGSKRHRPSRDDDDAEMDDEHGADRSIASTDALWGSISAGWNAMSGWRDATVDKWGRRLAYASGLSAKKAVKLKVLGADISAQVAEVLADSNRMLSRTRMKVGAVKTLCQPSAAPNAAPAGQDQAQQLDIESYDDSDFYAALLKEFVSVSSANSAAASKSDGAINSKAGYKHTHRSDVDRRASKSRRLRYVVHPKIAHFAAPAPYVVPPEMAIDLDTLLASLFKS